MTLPRWQVIVDAVTRDIAEGRLRAGDRIPSVNQLAERHGVSRGTVTRAIDILKARRLVRGDQGVGVIVLSPEEQTTPDAPTEPATLEAHLANLLATQGAHGVALDEVREEVAELRTYLIELYDRLGFEYPGRAAGREG